MLSFQTVCALCGPQIDGVPFGALQTRPLQLAGRQPSNRGPVRPERTADLEDDFDPRAVSGGSTLRPKAMVAKSAPVVDLLSMEDAPVSAPALPQPASSFDPFGSMAFDARGGQQDPFFGAPVSFPPTANKVISGNGSTFRGQTVPTMTAEDLARQLSGVSFAARPQPASGASIGKSSTVDLSQLNQTSMSTSIISKAPDVDQATASLVNLSNLMDDGPPKHTTAYRPVYTDNRSLEEIKATSKVGRRFLSSGTPLVLSPPLKTVLILLLIMLLLLTVIAYTTCQASLHRASRPGLRALSWLWPTVWRHVPKRYGPAPWLEPYHGFCTAAATVDAFTSANGVRTHDGARFSSAWRPTRNAHNETGI